MTQLWDVLLDDSDAHVDLVGSVYLPAGARTSEAISAAIKKYGRDALAVRRSVGGCDPAWVDIPRQDDECRG